MIISSVKNTFGESALTVPSTSVEQVEVSLETWMLDKDAGMEQVNMRRAH